MGESEKILDVHLEIYKEDGGMLRLKVKSPQAPRYCYSCLTTEDAARDSFADLLKGAVHKFIRIALYGVK